MLKLFAFVLKVYPMCENDDLIIFVNKKCLDVRIVDLFAENILLSFIIREDNTIQILICDVAQESERLHAIENLAIAEGYKVESIS